MIPAMPPGLQRSSVLVSILVVSVVSATTKSTCDVVRYEQSKSETKSTICDVVIEIRAVQVRDQVYHL